MKRKVTHNANRFTVHAVPVSMHILKEQGKFASGTVRVIPLMVPQNVQVVVVRVNPKAVKEQIHPKKDYTNQYAHHAKGDIICHRARVFPVPETELQNQELLVLILATD